MSDFDEGYSAGYDKGYEAGRVYQQEVDAACVESFDGPVHHTVATMLAKAIREQKID